MSNSSKHIRLGGPGAPVDLSKPGAVEHFARKLHQLTKGWTDMDKPIEKKAVVGEPGLGKPEPGLGKPEPGEPLTTAEHTEAHSDVVKGYRRLTEDEIALINAIKVIERDVAVMVTNRVSGWLADNTELLQEEFNESRRWAAIARTHFEQGFMAAVRAVARPE